MDPTIVVSGFIIVVVLAVIFIVFSKASKLKSPGTKKKTKGKAVLMKEASRRLAQDPHDIHGLLTMGDIYYQEQSWEKAYASYAVK